MSPTLFDSEMVKNQQKAIELEAELKKLKSDLKNSPTKKTTTMPQREEIATAHHLEKRPGRRPNEYSSVLRDLASPGGLMSAFWALPKGVGFESQHEKEEILMVLRQHPVVNLKWMGTAILLLLGPVLVSPLFPFFNFLPERFFFFLNLGWLMLILAYVIESILSWYYNLYIITDERLVDVDFYSLIYKSVSEAKLDKIEDVTATTAGVFGAMFDFGTISVQTAAEKREFELGSVPHPAKVTKFLNELILEEEHERTEGRVM